MRQCLGSLLKGIVVLCVIYLVFSIVVSLSYSEDDSAEHAWAIGYAGLFPNFRFIVLEEDNPSPCAQGGAWGDANGTIHPSLFISRCSNSSLYKFNRTAVSSVLNFNGSVYGSCWGDYNKDGWNDMVLLSADRHTLYMNYHGEFYQAQVFNISETGPGSFCMFADLSQDGRLDLVILTTHKLTVYENRRDLGIIYEEITNKTRLPTNVGSVVGVSIFFDRPTLIVISTSGFLQFYELNDPPYRNITYKLPGIPMKPLTKVTTFDMNHDTFVDLVLLYSHHPPIIALNANDSSFRLQKLRDPLHEYNVREEVAVDIAVADFNNDMLPDIYIAKKTTYNVTNLIYLRKENGTFEVLGGSVPSLGQGHNISAQLFDFNFDGYVDWALFTGGTYLFVNKFSNANNWIQIQLIAVEPHTISNAVVGVVANNGVTQEQVVQFAHKRLHFGLGNATLVVEIYVKWNFFSRANSFHGYLPNQLVTVLSPLAPADAKKHVLEEFGDRGGPFIQCPDGSRRVKPSFLIIGIWKAGTSSLAATLSQHEQLLLSTRKEMFYFSKLYEMISIDWYWSQFPCSSSPAHISFEATAGYMFSKEAPAVIQEHLPDAKFIVMLRDPVERMYSHYYMNTHNNTDVAKNFDGYVHERVDDLRACTACALRNDPEPCAGGANVTLACASESECLDECMEYLWNNWTYAPVLASVYYIQLQRWFAFFPREQFYFVHYPDFVGPNSSQVVLNIQEFLGLEVVELPPIAKNISPSREKMLDTTKTFLGEFYAPYNQLLFDLLEVDFGWSTTIT